MYVRNDVKVMCRPDLEESTIECLWVAVCPLKLRSFLVGTFFKPPTSSNHEVFDPCIFDNKNIVLGLLRLWIKRSSQAI